MSTKIDVKVMMLGRWCTYEKRVEGQLDWLSTLPWLKSSVEALSLLSSLPIAWAMANHRSDQNESFVPVIPLRGFTKDRLAEYLNLIPFPNRETQVLANPSVFAATHMDSVSPYYMLDVNLERGSFTRATPGKLEGERCHLTASEIVALAIHIRGFYLVSHGGFWAGASEKRNSRNGAIVYPYVTCDKTESGGCISCGDAAPSDEDMYWPTRSIVAIRPENE
jgi:hypothetical protein